VSSARYELGLYIPEDSILHSHRRGNLKSDQKSELSYMSESHSRRRMGKLR
jgi:hypothetical protein